MFNVKEYDKLLSVKKDLSWKILIKRQSPFSKSIQYTISEDWGKYIGSWRWIKAKIQEMDTTRNDITGKVLEFNKKIGRDKGDNIAREISSTFTDINILT